jgi:hypothetical protein
LNRLATRTAPAAGKRTKVGALMWNWKMQKEEKDKGPTVLICDGNKREMSNLSDALYEMRTIGPCIEFYKAAKRQQWAL